MIFTPSWAVNLALINRNPVSSKFSSNYLPLPFSTVSVELPLQFNPTPSEIITFNKEPKSPTRELKFSPIIIGH